MHGERFNHMFIQLINQNLGIACKVGRIYFQDKDERADVIQEMMYQLWKSYPHFDGRSKFSTWMYRVCLNTALSYKRRSKTEKKERLSLVHHQIADNVSDNREEEMGLLLNAITKLSSLNKAIILLYLDNLSYDEIASVVGLSRSNVSVRLVRIKKELEVELKSKFD